MSVRPLRLCLLVTDAMSARFLRGQVDYFRQQGFEVSVISNPGPELEELCRREGALPWPIPLSRSPDPGRDLVALLRILRAFRALRPDVVNAGTPKAGLLGMCAAWVCGTPVRVYTLRGLRYETARGPKRALLQSAERVAARCARSVVCVSPSLRAQALADRLFPAEKARVLGAGSSNGVRGAEIAAQAAAAKTAGIRESLGLEPTTPVIGFVGRLTADKGAADLWAALQLVRQEIPSTRLLLVGEFEAEDPVSAESSAALRDDPGVLRTGFVADASPWYAAMNILVFPTRREGFPNVPLEAASAGVPTVAYRATGTLDAVVDGVTGTLVPQGDPTALAAAVVRYLEDADLCLSHGENARRRALLEFQPERIWAELLALYRELLG